MTVIALCALITGLSVGVAGAKPEKGCPNESSGRVAYTINGTIGDPVPAPGEQPLWDVTVVEGAASEGVTVEDLAASLDLDVAGFYELVLGSWFDLDKNGDRTLCVKPFSENGNQPDYFSNFVDNNAAA